MQGTDQTKQEESTMKVYAYCRVSTERQSLKRQIDNISATYPEIQERDYYTEKYTGTTTNRPEWQKLLGRVQPGDTIVFDEVSRMSRDAAEGAKQYEELYSRGVSLVFLKEPHCNTDTYRAAAAASIPTTGNEIADIYIEATNKVLMILAKQQIELAFAQAQKERDSLSKRTKEGIRAARNARLAENLPEKAHFNRGRKLETNQARAVKAAIFKYSKDFAGSLSDIDCIKIAGCSRNSYYKYKAELRSSSAADPDGQADTMPESSAL